MKRSIALTSWTLAVIVTLWVVVLMSPSHAQIAVSANDNKVVNDNGTVQVVPNAPPDTVVLIDFKASPPRDIAEVQAPEGALAEQGGSSTTQVIKGAILDRVEARASKPGVLEPPATIQLKAPRNFELSDYVRRGSHEVWKAELRLHPLDAQPQREAVHDRIQRLRAAGLFGCKLGIDQVVNQRETWCYYVSPIDLSTVASTPSAITLPNRWREALGQRTPRVVWIVAPYRVDSHGYPLSHVEPINDRAEPLVLETDDTSFIVTEQVLPGEMSGFALPVRIPGKRAFEFREMPYTKETIEKTMKQFFVNLGAAFETAPIEAMPVSDQPVPPYEVWYRREFQPSRVLGSPYFELSTYLVKWYRSHNRPIMAPVQDVFVENDSLTAAMPCIWVYIVQSVTRAVGIKGTYEEPTTEELSKFSAPVMHAYFTTIHFFYSKW